ncbi:class I SAM-dependent methyltransferase [Thermanaerothrix sp. 4228-RoL]|jgi:predicted O-methyltransferase YrrM|uniref:Class I SAM-dependent methyltransferase n=2 Tax=Thermanaerothrix TaxID=1077886 RepID=A0ABU3NP30_9CHLR|nr:class I SAM-dependent methyltransferase [Thermanaerothrix sp. 4228-RoL]MDT8898598.1 class I SAM-dependent methyltransferase [Thermanaerothrix sp. 4228-RoL]
MFYSIPPAMQARMQELEARDARERALGLPTAQRLRQVAPDTGRFLALMAAAAPAGTYVEIGTSGGYSTLWIALGARSQGRKVVTFEIDPQKVHLARETFHLAQVEDVVTVIEGDALAHLPALAQIAFCFLDAEKDLYAPCYDLVVPRLCPGGWLIADNVISHREVLQSLVDRALADPRVDALVLPLDRGLLLCRKG